MCIIAFTLMDINLLEVYVLLQETLTGMGKMISLRELDPEQVLMFVFGTLSIQRARIHFIKKRETSTLTDTVSMAE